MFSDTQALHDLPSSWGREVPFSILLWWLLQEGIASWDESCLLARPLRTVDAGRAAEQALGLWTLASSGNLLMLSRKMTWAEEALGKRMNGLCQRG